MKPKPKRPNRADITVTVDRKLDALGGNVLFVGRETLRVIAVKDDCITAKDASGRIIDFVKEKDETKTKASKRKQAKKEA